MLRIYSKKMLPNDFNFKKIIQLLAKFDNFSDIADYNHFMEQKTGVIDFFRSEKDFLKFKANIKNFEFKESNKDLGDFQTPISLTDKITKFILKKGYNPEIILEPNAGIGNFIISAIKNFPNLKFIYAIEKQDQYEFIFKIKVLELSEKLPIKCKIEYYKDDFFVHNFSTRFIGRIKEKKSNLLILGNPPWITNSELSVLDSDNLPIKKNIKNFKGLDAITGKSNFDISEYIITNLIKRFSFTEGTIAILCKTSVIRNIIKNIRKLTLNLSNIEQYLLDSKKEFNINVKSALLFADLLEDEKIYCSVSSFYNPDSVFSSYGWNKDKFVSDIDLYEKFMENEKFMDLDGYSPLEWRQGVKHDAIKIMILQLNENRNLINGYNEKLDIENKLLFPFIKGSDLKENVIDNSNKRVIITQSKPNMKTDYISKKYPKLWKYLNKYSTELDGRKSRIYDNKPKFSIFGIGPYSFMPYKIGISGFYKQPNFSLIYPIEGKPAMLDDTSYFISFYNFKKALYIWLLLNTNQIREFLSSIVFLDSKRPYTKSKLMRVDLRSLINRISFEEINENYENNYKNLIKINLNNNDFLRLKNSL